MPNLDASFTAEVLRHDDAQIVATHPNQALRFGVRLAYNSSGYAAGQVLGKNSVSGLFMVYNSSGTSGENTAVCILEQPVKATDFPNTVAQDLGSSYLTGALFSGAVFQSKLTGLDSGAITALAGRSVTPSDGVQLFLF